jgi:hypothetical protein
MKTTAQVLLVIFFVISFCVGLLAGTLKFQLLDFSFWQQAFQKHNTYQDLAAASKTSFEAQISKQGGNKNDVKILTDLITPDNTKDLVNRNLANFLLFANGGAPQIIVYLPIDKVPISLLPRNLAQIKSEMTLPDLLTKFNFQEWQNLPTQNLSHLGLWSSYIFFIAAAVVILVTFFLALLVEGGGTFMWLGVAFILSGSLTFFIAQAGANLQAVLGTDLVSRASVAAVLAGILIPPVVSEIVTVWQILGLILFVFGIALFFVRKPR